MDTEQKIAQATGELIIAIGEGNFKSKVAQICYEFMAIGYNNCKERYIERLNNKKEK